MLNAKGFESVCVRPPLGISQFFHEDPIHVEAHAAAHDHGFGQPCLLAKSYNCIPSTSSVQVRLIGATVDVEPQGPDAVDVDSLSSIFRLPVGCAGVVNVLPRYIFCQEEG
jgi:hypothetical protein